MGATRPAGPLCTTTQPVGELDDGTLARWLFDSPAASPWGVQAEKPGTDEKRSFKRPPEAPWCSMSAPDIEFLFASCRSPRRQPGEGAVAAIAEKLGVEIAAVLAVAEVETRGDSFDQLGRPKILFERHVFHELTGGRFDQLAPDLSASKPGGYGLEGAQYDRLERAYRLEPWPALMSASWGGFQLMGRYYAELGYLTPPHMVFALAQSFDEHLAALAKYMNMNKKALQAMQKKDWAAFARAYNGPSYAKNQYDIKLEAAYLKHKSAADKAIESSAKRAAGAQP